MATQRHDPISGRSENYAGGARNPAMQLPWALHHLAAASAELDTAIARRMGLSAGDYLALKHLAVSSEPLGPVDLGRLLGLSSGAATGLVDRLERAGYARRSPHQRDRRRQIVTITDQARQHMIQRLQPLVDEINCAAARLTADQYRLVADVLAELTAAHRRHAR